MKTLAMPRRVPFVPQMEVAECGAACLSMILEYFGRYVPLSRTRALCGVSRDGVTALGIVKAARALGLAVKPVKSDLAGLSTLALPAVLHWEFNHFLVLERISRKRAVLVDPAFGRRIVRIEEVDDKFTGVALSFTPQPDFPREARKRTSLARYLTVLSRSRSAVWLVLGTALMLEALATLMPTATQLLIDHVIRPARSDWLWPVVIAVAMAALTQTLLTALRDRAVQMLNFALDLSLMTSFVDHLLDLPIAFLEQRTTGDLMQRVRANETLRNLSLQLATAMLDGLLLLGFAGLMFAYAPQLSLCVVALSVSRVLVVQLLRRDVEQRCATELAMRGRESTAMVEAFAAPEFVKAFGAESLMVGRYINRLVQRLSASAALHRVADQAMLWSSAFDGLSSGLVLLFGGQAVIEGSLSIGGFMGFVTLEGLLHAPLESIVRALSDLTYARSILTRVDDVLETPRLKGGSVRPASLQGAEIELDHVSFRYGPNSPPVCDDLCLRIRAGEKVAIVGPSGMGKSTISRLLLGMLTPSAGHVRIGGHDVSELDRRELLAHVGVVLQEPFFFDDTVRQNLSLFEDDVPLCELKRAAQLACIDEVIEALPQGYDTPLGTNAGRLSGGQRQRLALARALVRRPSILVLDEATSSLDAETEARIHQHLSSLACTRILIAHRLATVRDADRVLVFCMGQFIQQGTYESLSSQPGLFRDMLQELR